MSEFIGTHTLTHKQVQVEAKVTCLIVETCSQTHQ